MEDEHDIHMLHIDAPDIQEPFDEMGYLEEDLVLDGDGSVLDEDSSVLDEDSSVLDMHFLEEEDLYDPEFPAADLDVNQDPASNYQGFDDREADIPENDGEANIPVDDPEPDDDGEPEDSGENDEGDAGNIYICVFIIRQKQTL